MSASRLRIATGVSLVLVLLGVIVWQRQELIQLAHENAGLRERPSHLDELERLRRERWELDRYREQAREVPRLRNQVAQLLREKAEMGEALKRSQGWFRKNNEVQELVKQKQIVVTGERLDIAIAGPGFFEVQMADGKSAYTRDGGFMLADDGRVITHEGLTVLSGIQPIPHSTTGVTVMPNGEVNLNSPSGDIGYRIQITRFNNPAGLERVGRSLFRETTASGPPETGNPGENGFGELAQGFRVAVP